MSESQLFSLMPSAERDESLTASEIVQKAATSAIQEKLWKLAQGKSTFAAELRGESRDDNTAKNILPKPSNGILGQVKIGRRLVGQSGNKASVEVFELLIDTAIDVEALNQLGTPQMNPDGNGSTRTDVYKGSQDGCLQVVRFPKLEPGVSETNNLWRDNLPEEGLVEVQIRMPVDRVSGLNGPFAAEIVDKSLNYIRELTKAQDKQWGGGNFSTKESVASIT